jgi:hypothetical protein
MRSQRGFSLLAIASILMGLMGIVAIAAGRLSIMNTAAVNLRGGGIVLMEGAHIGIETTLAALNTHIRDPLPGATQWARRDLVVSCTQVGPRLAKGPVKFSTGSSLGTTTAETTGNGLTLTSTLVSGDNKKMVVYQDVVPRQVLSPYVDGSSALYVMSNATFSAANAGGQWTAPGVIAGGTIATPPNQANIQGVDSSNSLLASRSGDRFFTLFFPFDTKTSIKNIAAAITRMPPRQGGLFWVDGNLVLEGDTTYGSATDPVVLIINGGNLSSQMAGHTTPPIVYGLIYVIGDEDMTFGPVTWVGSMVVEGNFTSGSATIPGKGIVGMVDSTTCSAGPYVKLPGSWRDF